MPPCLFEFSFNLYVYTNNNNISINITPNLHFRSQTPSSKNQKIQSKNLYKMQSAEQLVLDLSSPDLRENALLELSKKRELFQDLAPLLWNSFGTIAALLQVLYVCSWF
ncbi:putative transcription regulator Rcd1-like family [Helianthus annuus]|nr:putative transcription regulator Rcd1-like family [Helianthus annuus]